jgi:hypothetical protein
MHPLSKASHHVILMAAGRFQTGPYSAKLLWLISRNGHIIAGVRLADHNIASPDQHVISHLPCQLNHIHAVYYLPDA